MVTEIIMPVLGMNQDTGTISEWLVEPGSKVKAGDPVMSVETDKAVQEIEARESGYMARPLYKAGSEVEVGKVIGHIVSSIEEVENEPTLVEPVEAIEVEHSESATNSELAAAEMVLEPSRVEDVLSGQASASKILASPLAKKIAEERGITLAEVLDAGAKPPLHAVDVRGYEKLESRSSHVRSLSRLQVSADPARLLSTLEQLGLDADMYLSKVLASLMAGARRSVAYDVDQQVIQIESDFTMIDPDRQGWSQIAGCDESVATSRLMNFYGSRVTAIETGQPLALSVVVTGLDHMNFEITFDPELFDLATMVAFVTELAERVENPMRQLI